MDVAEHLYTNLEKIVTKVDTASAEKVADALFEIGKDLTAKKNSALAAKWLQRAHGVINAQEFGQLSRDATELRLAISHALIQAYLDIGDFEHIALAENHIAYIENELGDKLVVLLLRTEVLLRAPAEVFDCKAYVDILQRIIRTIDISESSFKLVIHHVRKLDEKSRLDAISVLDDFLTNCVMKSQREPWIDKAILLRTHMAVRDGSLDRIKPLEAILDLILPNTGKPLSVNAAVGVQTVCRISKSSVLTSKLNLNS